MDLNVAVNNRFFLSPLITASFRVEWTCLLEPIHQPRQEIAELKRLRKAIRLLLLFYFKRLPAKLPMRWLLPRVTKSRATFLQVFPCRSFRSKVYYLSHSLRVERVDKENSVCISPTYASSSLREKSQVAFGETEGTSFWTARKQVNFCSTQSNEWDGRIKQEALRHHSLLHLHIRPWCRTSTVRKPLYTLVQMGSAKNSYASGTLEGGLLSFSMPSVYTSRFSFTIQNETPSLMAGID